MPWVSGSWRCCCDNRKENEQVYDVPGDVDDDSDGDDVDDGNHDDDDDDDDDVDVDVDVAADDADDDDDDDNDMVVLSMVGPRICTLSAANLLRTALFCCDNPGFAYDNRQWALTSLASMRIRSSSAII